MFILQKSRRDVATGGTRMFEFLYWWIAEKFFGESHPRWGWSSAVGYVLERPWIKKFKPLGKVLSNDYPPILVKKADATILTSQVLYGSGTIYLVSKSGEILRKLERKQQVLSVIRLLGKSGQGDKIRFIIHVIPRYFPYVSICLHRLSSKNPVAFAEETVKEGIREQAERDLRLREERLKDEAAAREIARQELEAE